MVVDHNFQKRLIVEVSNSELLWVHSRGYVWFHEVFIPTLKRAETLSLVPNEVLSDCYYLAGDVTEFNNAPKKALEYYHKALNFDPQCGGTYREIGNMLERIGKYDEALKYLDKAIALDPDDDCALRDRENFQDSGPAMYEEGDVLWEVCEHLANANPAKALSIIEYMDDHIGLRGKLYCYGAMDKFREYLQTWTELTRKSESLNLNHTDWFFMPEYIFDTPDIWAILLSTKTKFSGVGSVFDSLEKNMTYRSMSEDSKMRLSFQYYKHTASKNYEALKQLSESYPEWEEVRELL